MNRNFSMRAGVVLVIVVVCLIFVTIFFASMVDRVRREAGLTARASINERLYQAATAIGRLTIRKLQRDFEMYDKESENNIIDMVFNNTSKIKDVDYSDVIKRLDVVKKLTEEFKARWGPLDIEVKYSLEMEKANKFPIFMEGLENSPYERLGEISADVKLTHRGFSKHCKISKQFLLTRLFAPPFHRFTLFSPNAADLDPKTVNRLTKFYDDGTVLDDDPPLQLFNQRIKGNTEAYGEMNYLVGGAANPVVNSADSFVQNGWIYLGGHQTLHLNIMAGMSGRMPDKSDNSNHRKYGEYFHLYYTSESLGWRGSSVWNSWLESKFPGITTGNPPALKFVYVDYGYFSFINTGQGSTIDIADLEAPPGTPNKPFDIVNRWTNFNASALHLFGTPEFCTPTLIFGNIDRQFMRIWAFLVERNVWPIKYYSEPFNSEEFNYETLWPQIKNWLDGFSSQSILEVKSVFSKLLTDDPNPRLLPYNLYKSGPDTTSGATRYALSPSLKYQPYLEVLKNLAKPNDPDIAWSAAVPQNEYLQDAKSLKKDDYEFKSLDKNLHYKGKISAIKVNAGYFEALRKRTGYYINEKPSHGDVLPLFGDKNFKFFEDQFVDSIDNNENICHLNQIIGFDSSIEINKPLVIEKGGIIWTKKDIIISAPITNCKLHNPGVSISPGDFGWVTLVAGGNITIRKDHFTGGTSEGFPEVDAFLVACNGGTGKIVIDSPVHIIGGVAADNISQLVAKGSIIEWAFTRGELAGKGTEGKNDMECKDFYGLVMGPTDTEIVFER